MFTNRDFEQEPDLSEAEHLELRGEDITIDVAGVYVLSGSAENVTVIVDADDEAKVQLVLDGVSLVNSDAPAIYVRSADKVFVTTSESVNHLEVTGTFTPDGDTNLDAVVFSKDDLVFNGKGELTIVSAQGNGVTGKDHLKITGGTVTVNSALDGFEANDSICIGGGFMTIDTDKDGLHSENDEDDTVGYVYIDGGTVHILAADDAIRGTTLVQIDGGTIDVSTATEGIEATFIRINGGDISVFATDDGINAAAKSSAYATAIEVNGGTLFVEVSEGDTDAFDSNGDITINGGILDVVAPRSAFDADGTATLNGGTVTVNGETITEIVQSGPGGGPPN